MRQRRVLDRDHGLEHELIKLHPRVRAPLPTPVAMATQDENRFTSSSLEQGRERDRLR